MTDNEAQVKAWRWAVIENIATIAASCFSAYFIHPLCFLLLLNLNTIKSNDSKGGSE